MTPRASHLGVWLLVAGAACASRQYNLPMTAAELGGHGTDGGAALVAYLSQANASPGVCDQRGPGPHVTTVDARVRSALSRAFREGRIAPQLWGRCTAALLDGPDREAASALVDDALQAAQLALEDSHLESDSAEQARLDAVEELYVERAAGLDPRPETTEQVRAWAQGELQRQRLGPIGRQRATDLLEVLELERGRWHGGPVGSAALDALLQAGDERTLGWAAARLPDDVLRAEARRRVVRLHVRTSPFPEVRGDGATVEEVVVETGVNAVALAHHPPLRGWLDPSIASARAVVVQQRLPEQLARLLGYSSDQPSPTVLPPLPTRGALHVELAGLSLPVTVCASPRELDVTPCLPPGTIEVDPSLASVDPSGALHLADSLSEAAAVALGHRLVVPIAVAGRRVAELSWPLTFAAPADLVLAPSGTGARGPDLDVHVDGRDPTRLIYGVIAEGHSYQAAVEWPDATAFHVISRGAAGRVGMDGSDGMAGTDGTDGSDASCPSFSGSDGTGGSDGWSGGDGGPRGPGAAGGDVRVTLSAGDTVSETVLAVLRMSLQSQGGPGGPGGRGGAGGPGGRGGRGGSSATCTDSDGRTTSLSGGRSGASGASGGAGHGGSDGAPGAAGRVTFARDPG